MKRFLSSILLFAIAFQAVAQIAANDSRVVYSGRTAVENGAVSFDWSGTTVRIRFKGTRLEMLCSDTKADYFNLWVDKAAGAKEDRVIRVSGAQQNITLVSGLKKGVHEVILQKRTEGEQGCFTLSSFSTDGELMQADGLKKRHIECIGDSYTCGYGTESANRDDPFMAETENCNLAYGFILGRFFDAEVNLVSHSGRGIVRNYGDFGSDSETMTVKYSQTFDENPSFQWDQASADFTPDIVIIYLGTNDFSVGKQPTIGAWCTNYIGLLKKVRANHGPDVPVLCVASKADERMAEYVKTAVERSGIENVSWTAIYDAAHNDTSELGASWHPNYQGQRKVATCMAPYVSTLTGWDFPVKPIE